MISLLTHNSLPHNFLIEAGGAFGDTVDKGNYREYQRHFPNLLFIGQEFIAGNTTYSVILNNKAIYIGVGPAGDPISHGTAFLYYEFAKAILSGYVYSGAGRLSSAGDLQNAIWYLEGEIGPVSNQSATAVITKFGSTANAQLDNNGAYPVGVLNLYDLGHAGDNCYRAQDQLILRSVPEHVTMLLLGLGLVDVARIRRKIKG